MDSIMPIKVIKEQVLTGHKDSVYSLTAISDNRLYSAGGDGLVVEWDLTKPDSGKIVAKVNASIYAIAGHDNKLVVGENFQGIHVLDMVDKKEHQSLKLTQGYIFDIKRVGKNYWIVGAGGQLFVVSETMEVLHKAVLSNANARCILHLPKRNEVAIGLSDNTIRILNQDTFESCWQIEAHQNSVFTLAHTADQRYMISGSRDARLKIWEVDNFTLHKEIVAHMYAINHLDFSPDGQYFVTCSMDKSLKVWETRTFRLLKVIDKARHAGHSTSVNRVSWMSENRIASCSDDRTISIWSVNKS